jgi:hypothetical protein
MITGRPGQVIEIGQERPGPILDDPVRLPVTDTCHGVEIVT